MEQCAFIAASRVARGGYLLTAAMDSISFLHPTRVGDNVYVEGQVGLGLGALGLGWLGRGQPASARRPGWVWTVAEDHPPAPLHLALHRPRSLPLLPNYPPP